VSSDAEVSSLQMWYRLSGEGIVSATHAYRFACQKLSIIQTLLSDVRATAPDKRHREEAGARWLARKQWRKCAPSAIKSHTFGTLGFKTWKTSLARWSEGLDD
jgi:hypothetical protein